LVDDLEGLVGEQERFEGDPGPEAALEGSLEGIDARGDDRGIYLASVGSKETIPLV